MRFVPHTFRDHGDSLAAAGTVAFLACVGLHHAVHDAASAAPGAGAVSKAQSMQGADQGLVNLSLLQTLASGSVMLGVAALSYWLKLGMTSDVLVAYVRCSVQLTLLALVLTPILTTKHPAVVLAVISVMLFVAAMEVKAKLRVAFPGMVAAVATSLGVGVGANFLIGMAFITPDPWYSPVYVIPLWGMTLGNSLTAVNLGLSKTLDTLCNDGSRDIEALLSHGASRWEATLPMIRAALTNGLTPTINNMNVMGLVFLPGMMTGQLLGGSSATQACYYQLLILFMIAGASCTSLFFAIWISMYLLTDAQHRLRLDAVTQKEKEADMLKRAAGRVAACAGALGAVHFTVAVVFCMLLISYTSLQLGLFPPAPLNMIVNVSMVVVAIYAPLMLVKCALDKRPVGMGGSPDRGDYTQLDEEAGGQGDGRV
eukprot:TRINITY_DN16568_c0_g1_i1.p1 TRINITY_DN16568_c0_g1~~TRINITY_DN16568_c0_g1_i1.p1  ORF type:complete len:450 (+),score=137.07 TRINITY_DN16568_c0_g1_i1:72-1352(+)